MAQRPNAAKPCRLPAHDGIEVGNTELVASVHIKAHPTLWFSFHARLKRSATHMVDT